MNRLAALPFAALLSLLPIANAAAPEPAAPTANEHVARAVFTTGIQNREPVDAVTTLSTDHDRVYFFTDLRGLGGQNVTHRWLYQGKTMGEVSFTVGAARWRAWSSKALLPQWSGEWQVEVVDGAGNTLDQASFVYGKQ